MARYRKIDPRMWRADAKVRSFSNEAKLLWCYLLTGPETTSLPGVVPVPRSSLQEYFGWSDDRFGEVFGELFRSGVADADWEAGLVFLPNALRHNAPANDNVIKGWRLPWDEAPECPLKERALKWFGERLGERFTEWFGEPFGKGNADQRINVLPAPAPAPVPDPVLATVPEVITPADEAAQLARRRATRAGLEPGWDDGYPHAPPCPECKRPLQLRKNSKTGVLFYNHHPTAALGCKFKCEAEELHFVVKAVSGGNGIKRKKGYDRYAKAECCGCGREVPHVHASGLCALCEQKRCESTNGDD